MGDWSNWPSRRSYDSWRCRRATDKSLTFHKMRTTGWPNLGHSDEGVPGMAARRMTLAAALLMLATAGCVPVQLWVAERFDDKYQYPNDNRASVLPPLRDGFPAPICEDPPTD